MNRASTVETPLEPAGWLKRQRPLAGHWIPLTVTVSFVAGLLVIAQAWLLARVLHAVVFDDAGLPQVDDWLWLLLGVFGARALLGWAAEQVAFEAAARVRLALRERLLGQLFRAGPLVLGRERTGELVTAISDGVEALDGYFARYLPAMSLTVLLPLAILVVVFPTDWIAGLIMLVTAPLIPLFMVLIGKGAERLNQRQWRTLARLSAHFLDVIQGLTTLKLFNASRRELDTIARVSDEYRRNTMAVLRVAFLSSLALEFFATVSIAVVAVSIGFRLLWGEMDFLYGLFVLLLAPEFYLPLRSMGTHYHARMEGIGAAERLVKVIGLAQPAGTADGGPAPLAAPDPRLHAIRLVDVGVVYPGGQRALDGIDLTLEPGQRIAVVGASGAGKSTLAALLLGFVRSSEGQMRVGELPFESIDMTSWRTHLGWVPQRPHLFAASVADNIRLARPDAGDDEVVQAARRAQAADFIDRLPQGYATPIGEGGVGLSGGQAQRIALARAFLRDAALLILDEPTASLDADNERLVQSALDRRAHDATLIVIAHRLNTVRRADRILVLDRGRLVAQGTHEALLENAPDYRRLVEDFGGAG